MSESIATTWSKRAERRIEHVAGPEVDRAWQDCAARVRAARAISVGERSIATTCAPRRAASTASAPVPQPASSTRAPVQIVRQPRRVASRASRRALPAPSRGCGRAARRRSAASTPRQPCDRNRFRSRRAARCRRRRSSVESQQVEDVAVFQRRNIERLPRLPTALPQASCIRSVRRRSPALPPSRTVSISSGGCGGSRRDQGNAPASSCPTRALNLSIWSVAAVRFAITPPSRTG